MEEGRVDQLQMLVTNQHATELARPSVGPLHNPVAPVAQFTSIFVASFFFVRAVNRTSPA
jgi:hypothetical protein